MRSSEENRSLVQLRSSDDYSYLNGLTVSISGSNAINLYGYGTVFTGIATFVHASDTAMHYCPCRGCDIFDEFQENVNDSFARQSTFVDQDFFDLATDSSMWRTCEDFFSSPLTGYFCDRNVLPFYDSVIATLDTLEFYSYITDQEKNFIIDFLSDVRHDPLDIDFQEYFNRWDTLPKTSSADGWVSGGLLATIPIILKERGGLLLDWENEGVIDFNGNNTAALGWPRFTIGGYLTAVPLRFVYRTYREIFTKGDSGLQDSRAGKMIFKNAFDAAEGSI